VSESEVQNLELSTITGEPATLGDYAGSVLLVVNVASKCGLTPQYEALERLYQERHDKGFEVLGFPANDFLGQEPGTNDEIAKYCRSTYSVSFPIFSKIHVTGDQQHPLYRALISTIPTAEGDPDAFRQGLKTHGISATEEPEVLWNFEKFLVARDGSVVRRFAPSMTPDDPVLVDAIDAELAR
jgi:glutathione peroxidase